jgi:hypothetical protein
MGWATFWAIFFTNSSGHLAVEGRESRQVSRQSVPMNYPRKKVNDIRVARFFFLQHTKTGKNIPMGHKIFPIAVK